MAKAKDNPHAQVDTEDVPTAPEESGWKDPRDADAYPPRPDHEAARVPSDDDVLNHNYDVDPKNPPPPFQHFGSVDPKTGHITPPTEEEAVERRASVAASMEGVQPL